MKGVQCYELFGGIALKNHTFVYLPADTVTQSVERRRETRGPGLES